MSPATAHAYTDTAESCGHPTHPEVFLSDIHGEYRAFSHLLRNGCGAIRGAINELFADAEEADRAQLASLIYYPEEKLADNPQLTSALPQVMSVLAYFDASETPDQATQAFPADASDADQLIAAAQAIQYLSIKRLHVVGDIYDRGPAPDSIMDVLATYPQVDIQWGNHDIVWMGAALGQRGCVANVVRICARYGNLSILEDTYGMDLSALTDFALSAYADDPCVAFGLKGNPGFSEEELTRNVKIQKAMAIIQFKVEAAHIADNPSFGLESRNLLHQIDYEKGALTLDGVEHELTDKVFPTIDPADPYALTPEEEQVIASLCETFASCQRLQDHMQVFLNRGSLYKIVGNTLLFHACVPLNADGSLKEVNLFGETLSGKALFDAVDAHVRDAFCATDPEAAKKGRDLLWYLWLGEGSPLFAKSKMATLELYLITDKAARKEVKNPFYTLYENEEVLKGIFTDFGMDPDTSHIVCGHVPVKVKDGENPLKCGGKVIVIDGGMSEPYQKTTGVAGFALKADEEGLALAPLTPLPSVPEAIAGENDILPVFEQVAAANA